MFVKFEYVFPHILMMLSLNSKVLEELSKSVDARGTWRKFGNVTLHVFSNSSCGILYMYKNPCDASTTPPRARGWDVRGSRAVFRILCHVGVTRAEKALRTGWRPTAVDQETFLRGILSAFVYEASCLRCSKRHT